uniref:Cytochrome b-c1 complex subunit 8 n=1 Tax=Oryza meridionalis TaxID=40149 RepID=A0A0E0DXU5_9ORYZ
MGKTPVRMKAVVYALSPFQQKVMPGLWKDITTKIHHKVSENWISATLLLAPIVGTYEYASPILFPPLPSPPLPSRMRVKRICPDLGLVAHGSFCLGMMSRVGSVPRRGFD